MRIVTQRSWLLVGLSLAGSAASEQKNRQTNVVEFDVENRLTQQTTAIKGKPAVIWPDAEPPTVTFRWTIERNTTLSAINLYVNTTEVNPSSHPNLVNESRLLGSAKPPDGTANVALRQELSTPTASLTVVVNAGGGTVTIDNLWPIINYENEKFSNAVNMLYFDAVWEKGGKTGTSYSRFFTAVRSDQIQNGALDTFNKDPLLTSPGPALPDVNPESPDKDNGSTRGGQSAGLEIPTGSSSTIPGATSATPTSSGESGSTEEFSPKSKKGLSIGAIVGIAIACGLIGLALIGAIVFCCLRRHQKQNALGGSVSRDGMAYGGSGRNGDELMAEKEANAGVLHDVTNAPHSPYSDDGHNHQQHLMVMGDVGASNRNSGSVVIPNVGSGVSARGVLPGVDARLEGGGGSPVSNAPSHHMQHDQQSGRSYIMYSDHQSGGGGGGSPTTLHSGGGAPSLTHGGAGTESNRDSLISQQQQGRSLSTPYAHLVEEGMTEEQIRRLEEEERQLDAAIEQHTSGQRGSRNL